MPYFFYNKIQHIAKTTSKTKKEKPPTELLVNDDRVSWYHVLVGHTHRRPVLSLFRQHRQTARHLLLFARQQHLLELGQVVLGKVLLKVLLQTAHLRLGHPDAVEVLLRDVLELRRGLDLQITCVSWGWLKV